jgi:K+-transporting ATPase ATPase A chain
MEGESVVFTAVFKPLEGLVYKLIGASISDQMAWKEYTWCTLLFSFISLLFSYAVLRLQGFLPFNPMHFSTAAAPAYATAMTPDLAFNTAVSFTTNTNWQAYAGENTMSHLSQMLALAFHNWASAAVGIAVAVAVMRGFSRSETDKIGNFWADLVRSTLYILMPLSLMLSLVLVWQGVIQNFSPYLTATTLEGYKQIIPSGPVASQESIKMIGTNGGGFFNANSAHPFENPTPLTNFLEMLAIFAIPAGLTLTFGRYVGNLKQGWVLLVTMFVIFLAGTFTCYYFELTGNPCFNALALNSPAFEDSGGNMEGKEVRFGIAQSALFACVTTAASCGAVNCAHDSLTPLGGIIPLINIQLGEIIFGGVGSGLYGALVFAVLTVFIAGLMVGRTPEYVGKKIEKKEVKMAMLFVLAGALSILSFTAIAMVINFPVQSYMNPSGSPLNNLANSGPHGFSEMLYAFSSSTGNNGSAFAGLNANTPFFNLTSALAMLVGRFAMIIPVLALAGSLASKKLVPVTNGTFPTDGAHFAVLLTSVIIIVGALTYFPALTLGPIVEHFIMHSGKLF